MVRGGGPVPGPAGLRRQVGLFTGRAARGHEVGEEMFRDSANVRPGMVAHNPGYVSRVILRALRTGEERVDIPYGPEQPRFPEVPAA